MRPSSQTPAHTTGLLAELVCSNSLKSLSLDSPTGRLKADLSLMDSLIMRQALDCRVPAGKALAVDRIKLGEAVTAAIEGEMNINLVRKEARGVPEGYDNVIVATGPLTSASMAKSIGKLIGGDQLYFYDAIAPIVEADSIDMSIAFVQDRYGPEGEGDYLNLPMSRDEYELFVKALIQADAVEPAEFERKYYFEGCLPIEEIALRGADSLAYGPLKPVGLINPATGQRPHAVVQLRKETKDGGSYNLVGFQTKLKYQEQAKVFSKTIPGLAKAKFLRFGSLHRNTYVNAPSCLNIDLSLADSRNVRLAGQITGVEGYVESVATGLLAGLFTVGALLLNSPLNAPPPDTTLGALLNYITDKQREKDFQPSNINFSLFPPLERKIKNRKKRRSAILEQAGISYRKWVEDIENRLSNQSLI
ncbi:Methylenetetrahydrofolate--tRNA-(uracil-5-)-methyltransferase TrmFO [hydrothermal vent metagenome]|uniref:Methylenetetrahydrofolate--tRNA-(Uracil-5-)-methyltransferase TrmFO n=1 Tax=hydrothermal vent metagenome TaxID=652676 RepID=A0A3B1CKS4_9ZZZZ